MKAQADTFEAQVSQIVGGSLMNVALRFHFQIIIDAVHFMDEYFKLDILIHFVRFQYGFVQFGQGFNVIVVCVDDENECIASLENNLRIESRIEKVDLSGKVPTLKLHEITIANVTFHNFVGRFQEQRFIR